MTPICRYVLSTVIFTAPSPPSPRTPPQYGPVQIADVYIADTFASSFPLQIFGNEKFTPPSDCPSPDSIKQFGANGIVGVRISLEAEGAFYSCNTDGSSCAPEDIIKAAKANRNGQRDATMILLAFRHGLRTAEIVDLRWDQVDLGRNACLHVRRVKNGMPSVHPLQGDEMRALRALRRRVIVRVRVGAGRALHPRGLREDGGPIRPGGQIQVRCAPAHAASRVRLRACKQGA